MSAIQDESHLDMTEARERFEASTDFTLAIEEEFALVDPETLELVNRFEDIHAACQRDDLLAEAAVGELISSEIEIRSGKSESFAEATERQRERRERLSANSPFLDDRATGLHTVRTEIFTRTFPRCGVHEPFGGWDAYADFIDVLVRTDSIVEATQLWWSVRPHHAFGTVELRICDAQSRGGESFALAGMIAACIAQAALDYDDGRLGTPLRQREIEENLWRAIRHGMDG